MDDISTILLALNAGLVAKIVWSWVSTGRVDKGTYMTTIACEKQRKSYCLPEIKKEVTAHEVRLYTVEQRLEDGKFDFKELRKAMSNVEKDLSRIGALLERLIEDNHTKGSA